MGRKRRRGKNIGAASVQAPPGVVYGSSALYREFVELRTLAEKRESDLATLAGIREELALLEDERLRLLARRDEAVRQARALDVTWADIAEAAGVRHPTLLRRLLDQDRAAAAAEGQG